MGMFELVNENMDKFLQHEQEDMEKYLTFDYDVEIRLNKLNMFAYLVREHIPDPENYTIVECDNFDLYTLDGFMEEVQRELHSMINHLYYLY